MRRIAFAVAFSSAIVGCEAPSIDPVEHAADVEAWQSTRHATLMETDGWLTLVARHWLEEGTTSFGSEASNDWVYPHSETPSRVGTFHLESGLVAWESDPGARVTSVGGEDEVSYAVMNPRDDDPLVLEAWPLQWSVVRHGDRLAVLLKDAESPARTEFDGIRHFPVLHEWKLPARLDVREPPDTILVPDNLGSTDRVASPARVVFDIDGEEQSLDLWRHSADPTNFFAAFGDDTNGTSSHAQGRLIWVGAPDDRGRTWVDFNRAYNPPCAFTDHAACPLPPLQNQLSMAITAGELVYERAR